jgi:hypothetical protein
MHACSLLAALCFAVPTFAQETEGQEGQKPAGNVEKLWKIECSGIGG